MQRGFGMHSPTLHTQPTSIQNSCWSLIECFEAAQVLKELHMQGRCMEKVESQFEDCVDEQESQFEEVESQLERRTYEERVQAEWWLDDVGSRFEGCIEEVECLQHRRDRLVHELLELEQPMAQAVQILRKELDNAHRLLSQAQLEQQGLQEEALLVKRRLFVVTRDCIQSKAILAMQQHDMEQFAVTQEELQAQLLQLTQEASQLREQNLPKSPCNRPAGLPQACSDVSDNQQASRELQQFLQSGMRTLEDWYEPRLLALLKRRQSGGEALCGTQEQALELRTRLGPLKEEIQSLELQRVCLEKRIALMERDRKENMAQFRDTIDNLELTVAQLKTELLVQCKKNEEMATLKNSLLKVVRAHRSCVEKHTSPGLPAEPKQ